MPHYAFVTLATCKGEGESEGEEEEGMKVGPPFSAPILRQMGINAFLIFLLSSSINFTNN